MKKPPNKPFQRMASATADISHSMKKKIKISKLEAARRQLVTAIRFYFNNGDIVSMRLSYMNFNRL
jgi:hypothetical protein